MEEQQQLTKKQVWDVLQFADGLNNSYKNSIGLYTPDLLSKNLERLTSNPIGADYDSIVKALKDTPNSSELLSSFSQYMNYFDRIFSQTVDYFANILSFDLRWDCINAFGTDYSSKEYKEDEKEIPSRFILTGSGWGHGVGLCQIGAAVMGEQGYKYKEILSHYYPGSAIEQQYK